jgi:hypothetical protein
MPLHQDPAYIVDGIAGSIAIQEIFPPYGPTLVQRLSPAKVELPVRAKIQLNRTSKFMGWRLCDIFHLLAGASTGNKWRESSPDSIIGLSTYAL